MRCISIFHRSEDVFVSLNRKENLATRQILSSICNRSRQTYLLDATNPSSIRRSILAYEQHVRQKHKKDSFSVKSHPCPNSIDRLPTIRLSYLNTPATLGCRICAWHIAIAAASAASSGLGTAGSSSNWHTIYPTCSLRAAP